MLGLISRQWMRIALILAVFIFFLGKVTGLFELSVDGNVGLSVRSSLPQSLIQEGAITLPGVVSTPEFVVLLLVGLVLALFLPLLNPIAASVLTAVSAIPIVYLGYAPSAESDLLPMEYSLLTVLMLFGVNVLTSYFTETRKKQRLIDLFGQYVPPALVDIMSNNPEQFSLEGEARELSVMFCDVRNFTAISEDLGPKELAELLNTLFTPLTEIIYKHRGTIDKYVGDSIMAFWGAPVPDPDHGKHALATAFEMQATLVELGAIFRARGWPAISMGIGINSGIMNVGNMGSKYRTAYTVIGDAVNLASRLEELTRVYNADIIVGEATTKVAPDAVYRELGVVQVKGKNSLARIYEPCSLTSERALLEQLERHTEALQCYYRREWDTAAALFRVLKEERPDDPVYPLYLDRIEEFYTNPPPEHWQGEVRYNLK